MRTMRFFIFALLAMTSVAALYSCDNDDDVVWYLEDMPNALVTVKPIDGGGFYLQLDDNVTLFPTNVSSSPYGDKEVRALVRYTDVNQDANGYTKAVLINWMDSILTKPAVTYSPEIDLSAYGEDPIEIVRDWVNVAEDGYLTLRFRTRWGGLGVAHYVNLITGMNPNDPYEVEFRHNAFGDVFGGWGDALVAFRLRDLPVEPGENVTLTLRYQSFSGEKAITFDYRGRSSIDVSSLSVGDGRSLRVR